MQLSVETKHFDALIDQAADQLRDRFVARLSRWNQVCLRLTLAGLFNVCATEFVEVAQVLDAKLRRHLENGTRRDHLHRHDVAWTPFSSGPRIGKVRRRSEERRVGKE